MKIKNKNYFINVILYNNKIFININNNNNIIIYF
jgi:hypothetical protein